MHGIAIIQLCGENDVVFIIDINALRNCKKLDDMLISLFTQPDTTILGFGFGADLSQFNTYCGQMRFLDLIPKYLDVQKLYKMIYPKFKNTGGSTLAVVCINILSQKLCKYEQTSNWDIRPLR